MTVVVGYDCENQSDDLMAGQIINDLSTAYPGHAWFLTIKGGVVQIKDMDLNDKWGMVLHYSQLKADAKDRKRDVLLAAGEFLERARLKRGARDMDQIVTAVEGIPDKHMKPGL